MKEYRVFPYIFRNSALMSNMSISALATIVLIRTLSVVPSPCRHTETAFILVHTAFDISQFHLHALNIYLHGFVQAFCKEGLLVPNAFHCKATTRIHSFRNTLQQRLYEGALSSRDAPTARKTSSREPDISLLMLSSMSFPEIFRYSSNTGGRRNICIHPHSCTAGSVMTFHHVNAWQIPRRRCFRFLTQRTVRNLTSSVPHRASPASKIS